MKRVFLAGTTAGTTWRDGLIERLIARGVQPEQIINPRLPKGTKYTPEHMAAERTHKSDPETIVLIYITPAVINPTAIDEVPAAYRAEMLGPISMFEIGKFTYSQPHRTAVVLDFTKFSEGNRPRKALEGLAQEIADDFRGMQPYFASLDEAEDWVVSLLVGAE